MNKGKGLSSSFIVCVAFYLYTPIAASQELIYTYWLEALEPFAIRFNGQLTGGMVKDIGDELALRMKLTPKYIELPTKRVDIMLKEGNAHISCLTNPKWEQNPDDYHWSPVLFEGSDNFLVRKDQFESIKSIADFEGKRIGTYNGYVYSEQVTQLFEQGKAESVRVGNLTTAMRLVDMERLDTVIDFGSIIEYEIKKQHLERRLTIAGVDADVFDFHCSYSLKIPYDAALLDSHISKMKQEGFFKKMQEKYR